MQYMYMALILALFAFYAGVHFFRAFKDYMRRREYNYYRNRILKLRPVQTKNKRQ